MRRLVVFALLALSSYPVVAAQPQPVRTVAPQKVGLSPERLARIATVLNADIAQGKIPGAVVLVARRGEIAYFESFGQLDPATGKRMPKDAIFRAYSMTKPWASVAAMILVEEGALQLTDPVSKFIPSFKGLQVTTQKRDPSTGEITYATAPAEREPTIADLMRHTSGIVYDFVTPNAAVKKAYQDAGLNALDPAFFAMTPAEQIEKFSKLPLAYQPGTAWEYSFATDLLGRVIETVTKKRLSQYLEERIFLPLAMTDTAFWLPSEKLGRVAQPFAKDPITGAPNKLLDPAVEPKNDSGGAGGLTTTLDYYRFSQMMLNRGQLGGKRILSPTTVALMTSDFLGPKIQAPFLAPGELLMGVRGYTFGLGFMVREGPGIAAVPGSAGEFMWGGAAGTFFWIDPKEQLVGVLMSQAPGPIRTYYRRLIKQLIYQAIVEDVQGSPAAPAPLAQRPAKAKRAIAIRQ
jgi:CubicO group peptidase (beta-lactamase class C family)